MPLREELVASARGPLHLVFAAVTLLLLLACVNVANLALVRATGRVHEFAVRAALALAGFDSRASSWSRVSAGVPWRCGRTRRGRRPGSRASGPRAPGAATARRRRSRCRGAALRADSDGRDGRGVRDCPGSPPVRDLASRSAAPAVAFGDRHPRTGADPRRARCRAVGARADLLAGAAILLASLHRLQQVDFGVRVERVLTFEVNLPTSRDHEAQRASFQEELAGGLETIPGVRAAGGISRLPATGSYHPWNTQIRSGPLAGRTVDQAGSRCSSGSSAAISWQPSEFPCWPAAPSMDATPPARRTGR